MLGTITACIIAFQSSNSDRAHLDCTLVSVCYDRERLITFHSFKLLSQFYYLPPILENGGRYCFGVRRCIRRLSPHLPYISASIKASFLKFAMRNICKNNIAKMFLDFLQILNCSFDRVFFNFW